MRILERLEILKDAQLASLQQFLGRMAMLNPGAKFSQAMLWATLQGLAMTGLINY